MNGESTYQPNFVINEDDKVPVEKKAFEHREETLLAAVTAKGDAQTELIKREVQFIEGQRKKLRLFDPQGVYFYRHITISYFQSAFHIISLLISCYLIYECMLLGLPEGRGFVKGIGWVSNTTLLETIIDIFVLIVLFIQLRGLFKVHGIVGLKRYKLAMLANSINSVVIIHLKLIILFMIIIMAYAYSLESLVQADALWKTLENGVVADVFDALFLIILAVIILRSFRFCKRGLAE
tara:strand:+ start:740 stop:1450 length:711 start_codon:yes stop_codon:yes gene_type:complete